MIDVVTAEMIEVDAITIENRKIVETEVIGIIVIGIATTVSIAAKQRKFS